jgi:chromosome segregation ATPase
VERLRNTQATIARVARQRDSEEAGRLEALAERDALRAELDEAKGKLAESDGALVGTMMALDTVRNALDEARRERDGARTKLGFWRDWVEQRLPTIEWHGDHSARAAIDAKLAAAKAGPVVTVDDAKAVAFAIGKVWESPYRETLISVRDRLAAFVQARGETEAGK